nr:hypothetical protein [uncultured Sutterella sp.]
MPDVFQAGAQTVVVEECAHLRFSEAHRGREVHVVGRDRVDDNVVDAWKDAFFTAAKTSRQKRFLKNRPVIYERSRLGLEDVQKSSAEIAHLCVILTKPSFS